VLITLVATPTNYENIGTGVTSGGKRLETVGRTNHGQYCHMVAQPVSMIFPRPRAGVDLNGLPVSRKKAETPDSTVRILTTLFR
jgi:hypothetical protein